MRLARQEGRALAFNLHLGLAVVLFFALVWLLTWSDQLSSGVGEPSFFVRLRLGEYSTAIQDCATSLMQSIIIGMSLGYGLGGFIGLLSGIVRGRSFDRAINGSRIGMFVFAGSAVIVVFLNLLL